MRDGGLQIFAVVVVLVWKGRREREGEGGVGGGFAFVEDCLCLQVPTYLEDLGVGRYVGLLREGGIYSLGFFLLNGGSWSHTYLIFGEVQISQRRREKREREKEAGGN